MTPAELLDWRMRVGLTQGQVAELLGVDKMTIWRWEHGQRQIPAYLPLALNTLSVGVR